MTDRDRLAADLETALLAEPVQQAVHQRIGNVADRLIALGWTRLDEDGLPALAAPGGAAEMAEWMQEWQRLREAEMDRLVRAATRPVTMGDFVPPPVPAHRTFDLHDEADFRWLADYFSGYHGVPGLRAAAALDEERLARALHAASAARDGVWHTAMCDVPHREWAAAIAKAYREDAG